MSDFNLSKAKSLFEASDWAGSIRLYRVEVETQLEAVDSTGSLARCVLGPAVAGVDFAGLMPTPPPYVGEKFDVVRKCLANLGACYTKLDDWESTSWVSSCAVKLYDGLQPDGIFVKASVRFASSLQKTIELRLQKEWTSCRPRMAAEERRDALQPCFDALMRARAFLLSTNSKDVATIDERMREIRAALALDESLDSEQRRIDSSTALIDFVQKLHRLALEGKVCVQRSSVKNLFARGLNFMGECSAVNGLRLTMSLADFLSLAVHRGTVEAEEHAFFQFGKKLARACCFEWATDKGVTEYVAKNCQGTIKDLLRPFERAKLFSTFGDAALDSHFLELGCELIKTVFRLTSAHFSSEVSERFKDTESIKKDPSRTLVPLDPILRDAIEWTLSKYPSHYIDPAFFTRIVNSVYETGIALLVERDIYKIVLLEAATAALGDASASTKKVDIKVAHELISNSGVALSAACPRTLQYVGQTKCFRFFETLAKGLLNDMSAALRVTESVSVPSSSPSPSGTWASSSSIDKTACVAVTILFSNFILLNSASRAKIFEFLQRIPCATPAIFCASHVSAPSVEKLVSDVVKHLCQDAQGTAALAEAAALYSVTDEPDYFDFSHMLSRFQDSELPEVHNMSTSLAALAAAQGGHFTGRRSKPAASLAGQPAPLVDESADRAARDSVILSVLSSLRTAAGLDPIDDDDYDAIDEKSVAAALPSAPISEADFSRVDFAAAESATRDLSLTSIHTATKAALVRRQSLEPLLVIGGAVVRALNSPERRSTDGSFLRTISQSLASTLYALVTSKTRLVTETLVRERGVDLEQIKQMQTLTQPPELGSLASEDEDTDEAVRQRIVVLLGGTEGQGRSDILRLAVDLASAIRGPLLRDSSAASSRVLYAANLPQPNVDSSRFGAMTRNTLGQFFFAIAQYDWVRSRMLASGVLPALIDLATDYGGAARAAMPGIGFERKLPSPGSQYVTEGASRITLFPTNTFEGIKAASHSIARIFVTTNPALIQSVHVLDSLAPLIQFAKDADDSNVLEGFEVGLALTNIVSGAQSSSSNAYMEALLHRGILRAAKNLLDSSVPGPLGGYSKCTSVRCAGAQVIANLAGCFEGAVYIFDIIQRWLSHKSEQLEDDTPDTVLSEAILNGLARATTVLTQALSTDAAAFGPRRQDASIVVLDVETAPFKTPDVCIGDDGDRRTAAKAANKLERARAAEAVQRLVAAGAIPSLFEFFSSDSDDLLYRAIYILSLAARAPLGVAALLTPFPETIVTPFVFLLSLADGKRLFQPNAAVPSKLIALARCAVRSVALIIGGAQAVSEINIDRHMRAMAELDSLVDTYNGAVDRASGRGLPLIGSDHLSLSFDNIEVVIRQLKTDGGPD